MTFNSKLGRSLLAAALLSASIIAGIGPREALAQLNEPRSSAGASQFGLSTDSAATALTVPSGTAYAHICVEGQAVRYRDDGVAPTATVGMPIAAGACIDYVGPFAAIRFISQTSGATIDVAYYR